MPNRHTFAMGVLGLSSSNAGTLFFEYLNLIGRAVALVNLVNSLTDRSLDRGGIASLEDAIALHRSALDLRLPGDLARRHAGSSSVRRVTPSTPPLFTNLAEGLKDRYLKLGVDADLDESISLHRSALALRPPDHPRRPDSLRDLAFYLWKRYTKQATMVHLEEARSALDLRPAGHLGRATSLNQLVNCLSSRFEKQEAAADLNELITVHRARILGLGPLGQHDHATSFERLLFENCLRNLAQWWTRMNMSCLDEVQWLSVILGILDVHTASPPCF
ncbi:hypothetical protein V8B97DRAFT_1915003 [Scleroderma yunnanense]